MYNDNYKGTLNVGILTLDLDSTCPTYSRCLFSNLSIYFLLRYSHIPICATYWQTWPRMKSLVYIFTVYSRYRKFAIEELLLTARELK